MKPGRVHLLTALRRLGKRLKPAPERVAAVEIPDSPWAYAVEQKLTAIERRIASQNRLLIIAVVSLLADTLLTLRGLK
jgi:hypothetical protein